MHHRLTHPLWLHAPALVVVLVFTWVIVGAMPLPDSAPIHFGPDGEGDAWGSPGIPLVLILGLCVLFIGLSALFSELWARQEQEKTFNPFSLLDDIFVGAMVAMGVEYVHLIASGGTQFSLRWSTFLLIVGVTTAVATLLELLRPYRRYKHQVGHTDTEGISQAMTERIRSGQPLVYWESQNPAWMTPLFIAIPLVMFVGAVSSWQSEPRLVSASLVVIGLLLLLLTGGQRTTVTSDRVVVRFGTPGFRVLSLQVSDIASAEVKEFAPLKDFGGYGIRQNREMKAYYLRGTRGVLITTRHGSRRLIGSDNPDRLAAVVKAAASVT